MMTSLRLPAAFAMLLASALSAGAVDRNVNIHNNTGYTIYQLDDLPVLQHQFRRIQMENCVMGSSTLPQGT